MTEPTEGLSLWRFHRNPPARIHIEHTHDDEGVTTLCRLWMPYGSDLLHGTSTESKTRTRTDVPICRVCLRVLARTNKPTTNPSPEGGTR